MYFSLCIKVAKMHNMTDIDGYVDDWYAMTDIDDYIDD